MSEITPEEYAALAAGDHTVPADQGPGELVQGGIPDGVHISLEEAPMPAPEGSVGVQVPVNVIMDQIHQHWARQMADQVQRNAELAAALTVTSEELEETKSKLAALTEVTNAPAEDTPSRVREIPAAGGPMGRQED